MLNSIMLVGKVLNEITIKSDENGEKYANIIIDINNKDNNHYKIPVKVSGKLADTLNEYCTTGNMVGIKGYMKNTIDDIDKLKIEIVAEKISFLTNQKSINKKEKNIER